MCGRYTLGTDEEALIEAFDVSSLTFDFVPRYNIAPGQQAAVVAEAGKVPHWFHPPDRELLSFAGIWESWSRPGREARHTFAILTTRANQDIAPVHDRMPVVVASPDRDAWLCRTADEDALLALLRPAPTGTFAGHVVSARVNRASEDDAGLIEWAPGPNEGAPR